MKDVVREKKGLIIFCLITIIVLLGAFAAYTATGPMGIEERFNAAAGVSTGETEEEGGGGGPGGFSVEGNMMLYMLVLAVLAALCIAAYRHYHL